MALTFRQTRIFNIPQVQATAIHRTPPVYQSPAVFQRIIRDNTEGLKSNVSSLGLRIDIVGNISTRWVNVNNRGKIQSWYIDSGDLRNVELKINTQSKKIIGVNFPSTHWPQGFGYVRTILQQSVDTYNQWREVNPPQPPRPVQSMPNRVPINRESVIRRRPRYGGLATLQPQQANLHRGRRR